MALLRETRSNGDHKEEPAAIHKGKMQEKQRGWQLVAKWGPQGDAN